MDEFSGIDQIIEPKVMEEAGFAVGVVRGTRSFKVDTMGRLRGVSFSTVWVPGENRAQCLNQNWDVVWRTFSKTLVTFSPGSPAPAVVPATETEYTESNRPPHPMNECGHGFYAYYDGSDDYHKAGYVSGVVEGYGEAVIGTRGFRSMKARIVALHIPEDVKPYLRRLVQRNYPDVAFFDSFERMVAEFPPDSAGNEPTPDDDPDFWTRPA